MVFGIEVGKILAATAQGAVNDGSIPRNPAGCGSSQPRPLHFSLYIGAVGLCGGSADRDLFVFVTLGGPRKRPEFFDRTPVAAAARCWVRRRCQRAGATAPAYTLDYIETSEEERP